VRAGRQLIAAVQRKNRRIWLLGWIIGYKPKFYATASTFYAFDDDFETRGCSIANPKIN
jgi:hypothetical protein